MKKDIVIGLAILSALIIIPLVPGGIVESAFSLVGATPPFDDTQITVWGWVARLYDLISWFIKTICPGALVLLIFLIILKRTTDTNERK